MKTVCPLLAIMLLGLVPAAAEEDHHAPAGEAEHHSSGHHDFQHEIALFVGGTEKEGHSSELTFGLEYAHALTPKLGLGAILEHVGGDLRNTILAVPVYWKPVGNLFLLAAPGVEHHDGCGGGDEHHTRKAGNGADEDATHFLFRLGAGYSFHVGDRYSIIPQVNLDLVDGHEVWVWGAAFGVMF